MHEFLASVRECKIIYKILHLNITQKYYLILYTNEIANVVLLKLSSLPVPYHKKLFTYNCWSHLK